MLPIRRRIRLAAVALGLGATLARPAMAQARPDIASLTAPASAPWIRDGVIYELNTRTFSREGTFKAVTARLDELKSLGVTVLWIMPIHPIAELKKKGSIGSPYAVRDYYEVNPAFGTKADFKALVTAAHAKGLKVIIDIVANHTGWDNVMMKTPSYYRRDAKGQVISPYDWTDVAALNYENPALRRYMSDMLVYWAKEFALDGFRCDVAGEIPTDFWESARAAIEQVRPDIMMLAEAHKPDLLAKAFNLDYSWPLHGALTDVLTNGAPATRLREEWQNEIAQYPKGALHMRFSDDHDETRAIARFGAKGALAASLMMFTLDGVPLLYNGMEVGDNAESGAPQLFEKQDVFWDASRRPEFPAFYRELIAFRKAHPVLRSGAVDWLANSDADRVVSYRRRDASEELVVVVNFSNRPWMGTVEASGEYVDVTPRTRPVEGALAAAALPAVSLEAWGYRVLRRVR
jgi:cyclomaltodextrinase / maltogenic alpha-amylase / neopullulanase